MLSYLYCCHVFFYWKLATHNLRLLHWLLLLLLILAQPPKVWSLLSLHVIPHYKFNDSTSVCWQFFISTTCELKLTFPYKPPCHGNVSQVSIENLLSGMTFWKFLTLLLTPTHWNYLRLSAFSVITLKLKSKLIFSIPLRQLPGFCENLLIFSVNCSAQTGL